MRTFLTIVTSLLALAGPASATDTTYPTSIDAAADTWIALGNAGPNGQGEFLRVRNDGAADSTRVMMVRFGIGQLPSLEAAGLALGLKELSGCPAAGCGLAVYAIRDGAKAGCGDLFGEGSFKSSHSIAVGDSGNDIVGDTACFWDPATQQPGVQALGRMTLRSSDLGQQVTLTSHALTRFLKADTDGNVSFLLAIENAGAQAAFASRQHTAGPAPELGLLYAQETLRVSPHTDTFVQYDRDQSFGSDAHLIVKNMGNSELSRVSLVRFNVAPTVVADASLQLTLSMLGQEAGKSKNATFQVWGIRDGAQYCQNWLSGSETWNDISFLDGSGDMVDNSSDCLHSSSALGSFDVREGDQGKTFTVSNSKLTHFLNANTDRDVVFVITRSTQDKTLNTAFASSENPGLPGPRLNLTAADALDLSEAGLVYLGRAGWYAWGDIFVPVRGGRTVTAVESRVELYYEDNDDSFPTLVSMEGTAEELTLPSDTLFGAMDFVRGPSANEGYTDPTTGAWVQPLYFPMDLRWTTPKTETRNLPIEDDNRRLLVFDGADIRVGSTHLDPYNAGAEVFVDTATAAFYTWAKQPDSGSMWGKIANSIVTTQFKTLMGVSSDNEFVTRPKDNVIRESVIDEIKGNFFMNNSRDLRFVGSQVAHGTIGMQGDIVARIDEDRFLAGQPQKQWLRKLAGNGQVDYSVRVGPVEIGGPLVSASFALDKDKNVFMAQGSLVEAGDIAGFALIPQKDANLIIKLNYDTGWGSYLKMSGNFKTFGGSAVTQLEGSVLIGTHFVELDMKYKLGVLRIAMAGGVRDDQSMYLSGSFGHNWNIGAGKIKYTIKVSLDTQKADSYSISPTAKFCAAGKCSSIGVKELSVNGKGEVRMCVAVPGVGTKCTTIK